MLLEIMEYASILSLRILQINMVLFVLCYSLIFMRDTVAGFERRWEFVRLMRNLKNF
jgi:hypothetical protein